MDSQREPIRNPDQPGVIPFDVVHLRDLRCGMPEQIRDLFRREAEECPIRLFDSVYKFRSESVPEARRPIRSRLALSSRLSAFLSSRFPPHNTSPALTTARHTSRQPPRPEPHASPPARAYRDRTRQSRRRIGRRKDGEK